MDEKACNLRKKTYERHQPLVIVLIATGCIGYATRLKPNLLLRSEIVSLVR